MLMSIELIFNYYLIISLVVHISRSSKICSVNSDTDVYGFTDSVDNTKNINHSEDIIKMKSYYFESGSGIPHSLISPRVIGIVLDTRADTSTLHTYSEQMILDPMFPEMERTLYNNESSFFGQRFGVPFQSSNGLWYARNITSIELLSVYSIDIDKIQSFVHN